LSAREMTRPHPRICHITTPIRYDPKYLYCIG
jgi:hypothetical protein